MSKTSELGAVDPQVVISEGDGKIANRFSVVNLVESYNDLFNRAVKEKKGNLEPYLQQLANYDEREIKEYKQAISLSEDIVIQTLKSGMMKGKTDEEIKDKIELFLSPHETKTHGRAIFLNACNKCGLNIKECKLDSEKWKLLYELYIRTDDYVSKYASKSIESSNHSFFHQWRGKDNAKL